MDIYVKLCNNEAIPYTLGPQDTASTVLAWVRKEANLSPGMCSLEFEGNIVTGRTTLSALGVSMGDSVKIVANDSQYTPFVNSGALKITVDPKHPSHTFEVPTSDRYEVGKVATEAVEHFLAGRSSAVIVVDDTNNWDTFREILQEMCVMIGSGKEARLVAVTRSNKLQDIVDRSKRVRVQRTKTSPSELFLDGCSVHDSCEALKKHDESTVHTPAEESRVVTFTNRCVEPASVLTLAQPVRKVSTLERSFLSEGPCVNSTKENSVLRSILISHPRKRFYPYRDSWLTSILSSNLANPGSFTSLVGVLHTSPHYTAQSECTLKLMEHAFLRHKE